MINRIRTLLLLLLCAASCWLAACSAPETAVTPPPTSAATAVSTEIPPTRVVLETAVSNTANADVEFVEAVETAPNVWTFSVTVAHPDTGWDDYADGWDVVLPNGDVVLPDADSPFTRLLLHPHENEQPFTRSQSGIMLPGDVTTVTVRAHDLVAGFGGQEVTIDLSTAAAADLFTVTRYQP